MSTKPHTLNTNGIFTDIYLQNQPFHSCGMVWVKVCWDHQAPMEIQSFESPKIQPPTLVEGLLLGLSFTSQGTRFCWATTYVNYNASYFNLFLKTMTIIQIPTFAEKCHFRTCFLNQTFSQSFFPRSQPTTMKIIALGPQVWIIFPQILCLKSLVKTSYPFCRNKNFHDWMSQEVRING